MQRVFRRRAREIAELKRRGVIVSAIIGFVYFFPTMIAPVTFSIYISSGHTLDYSVAAGALVLF